MMKVPKSIEKGCNGESAKLGLSLREHSLRVLNEDATKDRIAKVAGI